MIQYLYWVLREGAEREEPWVYVHCYVNNHFLLLCLPVSYFISSACHRDRGVSLLRYTGWHSSRAFCPGLLISHTRAKTSEGRARVYKVALIRPWIMRFDPISYYAPLIWCLCMHYSTCFSAVIPLCFKGSVGGILAWVSCHCLAPSWPHDIIANQDACINYSPRPDFQNALSDGGGRIG
jgi:hypothetical protein